MACKLYGAAARSGSLGIPLQNFPVGEQLPWSFVPGTKSGRLGSILIAERDKDDAWLLSYALKAAGVKNPVRWLNDADEVIHFLSHGSVGLNNRFASIPEMPLLLFLEWDLPWGDALHLLKWIRQNPHSLALLVVIITKTNDPGKKRLAYEAGANWHFVKSKDFSDLIRVVRRLREFWSYAVEPGFY